MKKRKKLNLKTILISFTIFALGIITSGLTITYAATVLSGNSVYYDNTKSGGSSSNVSGALDELYAVANDQDALKAEIVNLIYPKGSIYMSTEDDTVEKVQTKFGGTWVKYSEGRTLVGVGTTTDSNSESKTFTANETGGEYNHKLVTAEIPSHKHTERNHYNAGDREIAYGNNCGPSISGAPVYIDFEAMFGTYGLGRCNASATKLTTSNAGGNGSHNNISPYTAVYMYKRIA